MTIVKIPIKSTAIQANNFIILSPRPVGIYGVKKGIFFTAIKINAIATNITAPKTINLDKSEKGLFPPNAPGIISIAAASNTTYMIDSFSSIVLTTFTMLNFTKPIMTEELNAFVVEIRAI